MISDPRPDGAAERHFGVYPAIVTNLVDPKKLGRIEVKLPWLGRDAGGQDVRAWATLVTPYADDDQGIEILPEVGTQGLVAFEAGDLRRPYLVGTTWNGKEKLPVSPAAANNKRVWRSRAKSVLEFDDTPGAAKVTLRTASGNAVVIDDGARQIQVKHANGCVITLTAAGGITIRANSTVDITAATLNVHCPVANFDGIVNCTTLVAKATVASPAYTPGVGEHLVSAHPPERDWAIVAPWWSWTDPARTPTGRISHPVFQKYQTSDPVSEFLADPQRFLRFVDDDVVPQYRRRYLPLRQSSPGAGKLRILASRDAVAVDPSDGKLKSFVDQRLPRDDGLRKIFLETHRRHYLVVCEVHCDAPGFPRAAREKICQAGFVVRRRTTEAPAPAMKQVKGILRGLSRRRAQLDKLDAAIPAMQAAVSARQAVAGLRTGAVVDTAQLDAMVRQRAFVADLLGAERERVAAWAKRFQVAPTLQGWFETPGLEGVGEWRLVEEAPEDLAGESTFPLYPLVPPDDQPDHAGHFGTIYFGLLPGHLADHDAHGRARFKEQEFYEVRCFVQRHLEPHDPDDPCRCPDRLFLSPPTEPYWLAPPYDLIGTSQRPVTISLPDLKDLAADPRPRTGATFSKPPGSLTFDVGSDMKPTNPGTSSGFQICTLPIPLIAIVAMFVFELFLPIVVFIFGLFWMLLLKFCIPPEIDVGAGLTAELAGQAPSLGVALDASGAIDMGLTSDAAEDALQLSEGWRTPAGAPVPVATWSADLVQTEFPAPSQLGAELQAGYTAGAVVNWQKGYRDASTSDVPDLTADLQFVVEKEHP